MPFLSDTLTECGYPWEVLVLVFSSDDDTAHVLTSWADVPGFHVVPLEPGTASGHALAIGLCQARGDAVLVLDTARLINPTLIPQMILQWESGARLVFATHDEALGASSLTQWDDSDLQPLLATGAFHLPSQATALGLLDRRLLDQLMAGP